MEFIGLFSRNYKKVCQLGRIISTYIFTQTRWEAKNRLKISLKWETTIKINSTKHFKNVLLCTPVSSEIEQFVLKLWKKDAQMKSASFVKEIQVCFSSVCIRGTQSYKYCTLIVDATNACIRYKP